MPTVIKIEEIQDPGLDVQLAVAKEAFEEACTQLPGAHVSNVSKVHAKFQKVSGRVLLNADFSTEMTCACKRCLKEVSLKIPVEFTLNLVSAPKHRDPQEEALTHARIDDDGEGERVGTFSFDDVDTEPFDGRSIVLDPIVSEQLALALPTSVVCEEGCKGLCTVCGQNLNEKECGCERKPIDVRLAKLKDIKLN